MGVPEVLVHKLGN